MSYVGAEKDPNTQFLNKNPSFQVETSKQQNKCLSFGLLRYLSVHIVFGLTCLFFGRYCPPSPEYNRTKWTSTPDHTLLW